jgi:hypothetical protein
VNGFGKGVETRGGTVEKVEEPARERLGGLVGVGWLQVEVHDDGLVVVGAAGQKGHTSVVSHLYPSGVHSLSSDHGDGMRDPIVVVHVSRRSSRPLEVAVLSLFEDGDAGLESSIRVVKLLGLQRVEYLSSVNGVDESVGDGADGVIEILLSRQEVDGGLRREWRVVGGGRDASDGLSVEWNGERW